MKKVSWISLLMVIALLAFRFIGENTITGAVKDESGAFLEGVLVSLEHTQINASTDKQGRYSISVPEGGGTLIFSKRGFEMKKVKVKQQQVVDIILVSEIPEIEPTLAEDVLSPRKEKSLGVRSSEMKRSTPMPSSPMGLGYYSESQSDWNTEEYQGITENIFHGALRNPLSTFSIDVDAASYSNVRRFINNGQHPPKDAVRIEELINYFDYDYTQPKGDHPFNIITEIAPAPWNRNHQLVHIGLQGRKIPTENLPPSNLVFLLDVSGSMGSQNKLPLLKSSLKMLVENLREQDHVSIVVYAGAAGLVLEPTSGANKQAIVEALDRLQSGGSTAGGAGIRLAYEVARKHFKKEGNNRIILATDGDFNIGESSNGAMERLIEEKRKEGVFLTVLGFGMGNYKDSKMEILADKGNGNYAYIDNISEARKVLVNEFGGTLFTIAKDVKLQIEFNPAKVQAYRLVGYENRMLKNEDFNNDQKDAGELGAGHTVTALYEIIPVGVDSHYYSMDELKYQTTKVDKGAYNSDELMTIKFRYKLPKEEESKLIIHPLKDMRKERENTSINFRWSAAVASFGMLLRDSEYVNGFTFDQVVQLAQGAKGEDAEGYRTEFITLVKSFGMMASK